MRATLDLSAAWGWGGEVFFLLVGAFCVATFAFGFAAGATAGVSLSLAGLCVGLGTALAVTVGSVSVCLVSESEEAGDGCDEGVRYGLF